MKHLFLSIATLLVLTNTSFAQEMLIRIPQHTFEHLGIKALPQTTFISERKYEVLDGEPNLFSVRHYQLDLAKQHVNSITDTIYTETGRRIKHHQFEYSDAGQLIHYTAEGDYELTITYAGNLISKVEKKALSNDQTSWVNEHFYDKNQNIVSTSIKNLESGRTFKATYVKSLNQTIKSDDGLYTAETIYAKNGTNGSVAIKVNGKESRERLATFVYASKDYLPLIEPTVTSSYDDIATELITLDVYGGLEDWTGKFESTHSDLLGEMHNYYITRAYYSSTGKILSGETSLTDESRKKITDNNPTTAMSLGVAYYQKLGNSIGFEIMGNIEKHVIKGSIAPNGTDVILYESSLQATYLLESFMSQRKVNEKWYRAKYLAFGTDPVAVKQAEAYLMVKEGQILEEAKWIQVDSDIVCYVPELSKTYSVKDFQKMEDNRAYAVTLENNKSRQFYVVNPDGSFKFYDRGNPIQAKLAGLPNKDILLFSESNNTSYLIKNFSSAKPGEYSNAVTLGGSENAFVYKDASTKKWSIFLKGENIAVELEIDPGNSSNMLIKLSSGRKFVLESYENKPNNTLLPIK